MKIYTKTGDTGNTQVYLNEMQKRSKADILLDVYGTLDELNAQVGVVSAQCDAEIPSDPLFVFAQIQQDLFAIGFVLSASQQLDISRIDALEQNIDAITALLPAQTSFILPGGTIAAAQCHVARTVCRRAERLLVALKAEQAFPEHVLAYVNRLSDLLFVQARYINFLQQRDDIKV